jgi:isocitrate dehydrogenase
VSTQKVGTSEFADAVIANLGKKPTTLKEVSYAKGQTLNLPKVGRKTPAKKELMGVDVFVHWAGTNPNELAEKMQKINNGDVQLSMITNRGIKVWPDGFEETFCTDHWRCRFKNKNGGMLSKEEIIQLLQASLNEGIDTIKTENLYNFDGVAGYSLGQGQ